MTQAELVKQMMLSFGANDRETFHEAAREYIAREKRMNHAQVARDLERALFNGNGGSDLKRRYKTAPPVPRDSEKGFPLLEIKHFEDCYEQLILPPHLTEQLDQILREYKDAEILATYNLTYKKKILLCGPPGTGKTFTARVVSSLLNLPLVYVRFDSIISSYLGETASNLRKVFDYIEQGSWIVLFDEFDVIGKNRDDFHEHGEIKRVVNNFLQMLDNFGGESLIFCATNHQHLLDPAIWRRFDDVLYYDLPDTEAKERIFDLYLKPIKRDQNLALKTFAAQADQLSPADIKMIVEEAIKLCIIDGRKQVAAHDLEKAIRKFSEREKRKSIGVN